MGESTERPAQAGESTRDRRFSSKLIIGLFDVLERHGYRKASDAAGGRAAGLVKPFAETYTGENLSDWDECMFLAGRALGIHELKSDRRVGDAREVLEWVAASVQPRLGDMSGQDFEDAVERLRDALMGVVAVFDAYEGRDDEAAER